MENMYMNLTFVKLKMRGLQNSHITPRHDKTELRARRRGRGVFSSASGPLPSLLSYDLPTRQKELTETAGPSINPHPLAELFPAASN